MTRKIFTPYRNESDCIRLDELTVENRLDRISLYGSIDLTRDKNGLAATRELKKIIDAVLSELEKAELPEKITLAASESVDNPFCMSDEAVIEYERNPEAEEGIVVPLERINPDTLRCLVEEFVTREWSELTDGACSLDGKVEEVLQQLQDGKALVVFDLVTETCNIIPSKQ